MGIMENELIWFETAKIHLKSANDNLNIRNYYIAYQEATWCGECLLKAILVKNNKFISSGRHRDKHHNIVRLLDKIKTEQCLSSTILSQVEDIIEARGFGYIDVTSTNGTHMDCISTEAPNIRYPINGAVPNELFDYNDAFKKIEHAEQLLQIISQIF
jgi:HEPN domain-containing protein